MCRFIAYLGEEALLENVLVRPENSLIRQSVHASESPQVPTNGDGFGIGWYAPHIDGLPALFTSIFPAWSDKNLLHLTSKVTSPCFFGHVRAASVGGINPYNCHPFAFKKWMLMHNGEIGNFVSVKRHLRRRLDDEYYDWIKGETDSEHLFAFFMQHAKGRLLEDISEISSTLLETYSTINQMVDRYGDGASSYLNVCLTDGEQLIATRYCRSEVQRPNALSLHYIVGYGDAEAPLQPPKTPDQKPTFVLVTSERLTHWRYTWQPVPENHLLLVSRDREVTLQPIEIE